MNARNEIDGSKLCAEARRRTGLEDFGDPELELRLSVLVNSIESEANLHPMGRFLARMHLRSLLETRLLLTEAWKKLDDLDAEPIQRPIFITGMPRSGSTFLHELLAQDTDNRAPLAWEVMSPLPTGVCSSRRRMWHTGASLWCFRRLAPHVDSVHPIRATSPHECVAIHSYTMLSREFPITFRIPEYETFLDTVDFALAYVWQKRFLQYLQWRRPAKRWILKAPDHVFSLEPLHRIFPDAIIIQTHRNPFEVLESSIRLLEVLRQTFAHPRERHELGIHEAHNLAEAINRSIRFREEHPELAEQFFDVHYDELVSDPLDIVRKLYQQLRLPLTNATIDRVCRFAASRSRYGQRQTNPTKFTLGDFGMDQQFETRQFTAYCVRFGISSDLKTA